ncbi:DEAD/DEAH box helicase [Ignisphaera sp. 4213-co]|uniref:DNA 3'-5' helicase n=1 Tax=Ignisphaera cupida TaxID=3050454 RepID=A0ABD4ZBK5_9CREN|nr:DEAD/DEAH box helicase [Ignisphaera sp. 4213-co]MDK6029468.1 DEAD/DEAH box helicase [Ignisphaera sp. 4213-co]
MNKNVIVFYVKEWIDEEDFETFLKFAKYLGKDNRGSKFVIDVNKLSQSLRDKKLSSADVIDLMMGYEIEFVNGSLEDVKKLIASYTPTVVFERGLDGVYLRPNFYISDLIKDLREKHIVDYDREKKVFRITKPMYFFDVLETLKRRGVEVENRAGIEKELKLPIRISFKGSLRDYQKEALDAWRSNGFKGIIALPTGTGKTVIAVAAIAELSVRTLVVTYTKEQMFQWGEKIVEFTDIPKSFIGFFYGDEKRIAPVTIITYQSAYRYIDSLSHQFSFLIVDEVHHLPAEKFRFIAENTYAAMRMGLSATVVREDGKHVDLFPLMGGVVYAKTLQELADRGYIAPFKVITVRVSLTEEEKKKYKELMDRYRKLALGREFQQILADVKKGDASAMEALKIRSEIRMLIANAKQKIDAIKKIVEDELEKGSKILIFTQYIEHAKKIAESIGAQYVIGELDEGTRKRRLEQFKSGLVKVLVLTTVGDEGIDIPDANVGIIATGTGSRRQFIQRLGRILRPLPGKEARLYEVIVKNTFEEAESRKRREALKMLFEDLIAIGEAY